MKINKLLLTTLVLIILNSKSIAQPNWPSIKSITNPSVSITSEFGTPYKQPLSVLGWEDGIFISRDGLNLYCIYVPIDLFSWTFFGPADPTNFSSYLRGPTFGMDLVTNPIGASEWLQADILYAQRNTTNDSFLVWSLSNLTNPIYSEGAPQHNAINSSTVDLFVTTSNNTPPDYSTDIVLLKNTTLNPSTQGTFLPAPVNTQYKEDNPHIERIDPSNLVLFFDSDNRPGGLGQLDIWYTTSSDNGLTWSNPLQVSSLNTASVGEQQPHLYKDSNSDWYIYYTGANAITGKTEIYRAKQAIAGNWDSWINKESVVSAGNSLGVGEPTLTQNGDLSFVVLYQDAVNGTATDKYDADPWFLPKIGSPTSVKHNPKFSESSILIYPNPSSEKLSINLLNTKTSEPLMIFNAQGILIKEINLETSTVLDIKHFHSGLYFIYLKNNPSIYSKFMKQ